MCLSVLVLSCVVQGCLEKAGTVAVGNIFTHRFLFCFFINSSVWSAAFLCFLGTIGREDSTVV